MRVLSFSSFSRKQTAAKGQDWSQQEIADFYRAHRLLAENGAAIGIDRGQTDIGEPWIVFYDLMTQDVFLHVGRIDGECILICEALGIRLKAATISDLVPRFEAAVRDHISVRSERQGNVVLHPAARIIMAISAVFLLSKLDGTGVAQAGEIDVSQQAPAVDAVKKADVTGSLSRAQSALTRLFDTTESPRAVASIAGAILTGELLVNLQPIQQTDGEAAHKAGALPAEAPAVPVSHIASSAGEDHVSEVTPINLSFEEEQGSNGQMPAVSGEAQIISFEDHVTSGQEIAILPVFAHRDAFDLSLGELAATTVTTAPRSSALSQESEVVAAPQAVEVLQAILGHSLKDFDLGTTNLTNRPVLSGEKIELEEVPTAPIEISLATLDTLDDTVSFYLKTALSNAELTAMLNHFIGAMSVLEIEFVGERILIEQLGTEGLSLKEIGLWTNVLEDGSSISLIGQATLIDDIGALSS